MRVGVIDVGTNSVRVLVTDVDGAGANMRDVVRELTLTRLGEGVDRDRKLGAEPLRRTVAAIAGYAERCRTLDVSRIRIIATSAVRDAANRADFVATVRAATDVEPDVLSGDEEARLGFAGATLDIDEPSPYLVIDIGGGSTEFVRGTREVERAISVDIGSVRLTERHVRHDPPLDEEVEAVRADAAAHVARAATVVGDGARTLIGLAGTITTLSAIALGLDGYDRDAIHHHRLGRADVQRIRSRLTAMTSEARRELPAMPRGREDVIVAGTVILEEILARFRTDECLVSETDILDGTAASLARAGDGAGPGESR